MDLTKTLAAAQPIFTDEAVCAPHFLPVLYPLFARALRMPPPPRCKHKNSSGMSNETPCCNLIHLSISFPFFHQFLFPRIDCTSVATRSDRARSSA
jgi:hypothetical protein